MRLKIIRKEQCSLERGTGHKRGITRNAYRSHVVYQLSLEYDPFLISAYLKGGAAVCVRLGFSEMCDRVWCM